MISYKGCDMIAMKREVAARVAGFPWSECQVRKLTTSHCTDNMIYNEEVEGCVECLRDVSRKRAAERLQENCCEHHPGLDRND